MASSLNQPEVTFRLLLSLYERISRSLAAAMAEANERSSAPRASANSDIVRSRRGATSWGIVIGVGLLGKSVSMSRRPSGIARA